MPYVNMMGSIREAPHCITYRGTDTGYVTGNISFV